MNQSDYVVVGAGSAGCALTFRLVAAGATVTLIEHGGGDRGPFIGMPGALSYPMNMARYDWGYRARPEAALGGRALACPRGKVIGGSSSINGMVYVRGHAGDYAHWEAAGAAGWGPGAVQAYFRRMESWHGGWDRHAGGGDPGWRGMDGPLHVSRGGRGNPLVGAFLEAGRQAGFPATGDYNGRDQEGIGALEATIHEGGRWSAARAYLDPARATGRVRLVRGLARRVTLEAGRATGVEIEGPGGVEILRAGREVILSAGAINSPKLLMLSGIGPAAGLQAKGVDVAVDLPGVGANLQDHLEVYVQAAASQPVSLYRYWNLHGKARVGLEWLLRRSGPGASNQFEAGAFLKSHAGASYPDVQFHFLPLAVRYDGRGAADGFQIHTGPMRSGSRGHVMLDGPDPARAPEIRFNYMTAPGDWEEFRQAVRMATRVLRQPAFAPYFDRMIGPGAEDDASLDAFVAEHAESAYHPCGTCRVGAADDPRAVVDPELRVRGVGALRVIDSSVFPRITYGNLNAPSIMVGEKGADHVLGRGMLPPVAEAGFRAPVEEVPVSAHAGRMEDAH